MRIRPVDAQGDMMPIQNLSQMKEGGEAVAEIARERLLFYYGEWWEDESVGLRIPEFLADTIKKNDVDMVAKYITSYLSETEGVVGISNVRVEYNRRRFVYSALLVSGDGAEVLEVDLSGLL